MIPINVGLDFSHQREVILTLIMIGCGMFGAFVNYVAHKWSNGKTLKNDATSLGLLRAVSLGAAAGFLFAYFTKGGTGIGHWDAAFAAFIQGLGYESVVGKLRGLYATKMAARAERKAKEDAEEPEDDEETDSEKETDTKTDSKDSDEESND